MPRPPILSSTQAPWQGIRLEHFKGGPADTSDEAPLWHTVLVQLDQPTSFEWRDGERTGRTFVPAWNVGIYPALKPIHTRCQDTRDFICLALEPEFLHCAAHEISQPDGLELSPRPVNDDPFIRGLALALESELRAGCPGGRWYGESLGRALAVHLVRRYAAAHTAPRDEGDRLGRVRLQEVLDHIHQNLAGEITLGTLASTAGLSQFHFARLFKRATGLAPHQYVIRRRVEKAKQLLVSTQSDVADIAVQTGFCDQSHLTTHFKRVYGVTPRVFTEEYAFRRTTN